MKKISVLILLVVCAFAVFASKSSAKTRPVTPITQPSPDPTPGPIQSPQ